MIRRYYFSVIIFLAFITNLFARLGGGQGHGRTSGGRTSSGGGGGGDITWLIYLIFKYPLIGIPAAIIAIFLFFKYGNKANHFHQERTISKYSHAAQTGQYEKKLQKLKAVDPEFDEQILSNRVSAAFINLQQYWSDGEIQKIRPFVSDGAYESFSILLDRYQKNNLRNDIKDMNVLSCKPVDVESSKHYHTITFKIIANAVDSIRDSESGKFLSGSKSAETFTEYWSFIRKPGAQTLNKPGLMEGNCPNCAYLLEMTDKVTCPSCQAVICSGEYDWLLVEISQSDWKPNHNKRLPGLKEMRASDPGFNRQAIEDRVSTSFWNVRRAEFEGSCKFLSKYAHPDLIEKLQTNFKTSPGSFYADPAVGTVDVLNVQTNDQGMDRVYAKVNWSGHAETRTEKRRIPDYYKSVRINDVYIFERQSGVLTESKNSLTSAHCPGCGAPTSDQTHGNCQYCGTPFNDGSKDWILTAIMPYQAYKATVKVKPEPAETTAAPIVTAYERTQNLDKELVMAIIIESMLDDNVIDDEEQAILMEFLEHLGMTTQHINQLMNGIYEGSYTVSKPKGSEERLQLLREVVNLCLLDSKITKSEGKVLEALTVKLGYVKADLKMMIRKQRGELFKEGKGYLKAQKKS